MNIMEYLVKIHPCLAFYTFQNKLQKRRIINISQ